MINNKTDLHTHSNFSDGTMSPYELMNHAMDLGLQYIALTDHDTVNGIIPSLQVPGVHEHIPSFRRECEMQYTDTDAVPAPSSGHERCIELIPGIEISGTFMNKDLHILGYYVNYRDESLLAKLRKLKEHRYERNLRIIKLMNDDGIPVTYRDLVLNTVNAPGISRDLEEDPASISITRGHFAGYLMKTGIAKDRDTAFRKYLGHGMKYYLPKETVSPLEAVDIILKAGGIPFIAHMMLCRFSDEINDRLVSELSEAGLKGIEVYHSSHGRSDVRKSAALAEKYGLEISGGSDFHGENKPGVYLGTGRGNLPNIELPRCLK